MYLVWSKYFWIEMCKSKKASNPKINFLRSIRSNRTITIVIDRRNYGNATPSIKSRECYTQTLNRPHIVLTADRTRYDTTKPRELRFGSRGTTRGDSVGNAFVFWIFRVRRVTRSGADHVPETGGRPYTFIALVLKKKNPPRVNITCACKATKTK